MDVTLVLSLGLFYLSLAGLAAIVGYRTVKWVNARRSLISDVRKKWDERRHVENVKEVFGTSSAVREHSIFTEAFSGKRAMVMKAEPIPTNTVYSDPRSDESVSDSAQIPQDKEIDMDIENPQEELENDWDEVQLTPEADAIEEQEIDFSTESSQISQGDLSPQKIITLLRRVDALIARKDFDEAKKILIRILSWQEDHFDAGAHLAFVYLQSGEHRKAESLYRKALELRPRDASLLTNFALAVLEQKDPMRIEDSVKAFRLAAELDPKNPNRYANLGQSLFFAGDIPKAIAAFEKAVRLAPRNVEYYFFLADSYLTIRNFALAKKVFSKILDLAPLNQEAKQELSELQRMGY